MNFSKYHTNIIDISIVQQQLLSYNHPKIHANFNTSLCSLLTLESCKKCASTIIYITQHVIDSSKNKAKGESTMVIQPGNLTLPPQSFLCPPALQLLCRMLQFYTSIRQIIFTITMLIFFFFFFCSF